MCYAQLGQSSMLDFLKHVLVPWSPASLGWAVAPAGWSVANAIRASACTANAVGNYTLETTQKAINNLLQHRCGRLESTHIAHLRPPKRRSAVSFKTALGSQTEQQLHT